MTRKYFFLAVNTGLSTDQLPDERCRQFYRDRSGNGLYCTIVGNVVTPDGIGTNTACSVISSDEEWARLALSISEQGALPGIQLSSTWSGYNGIKKFIPSSPDDQAALYQEVAASISIHDARLAFDSLFRGTELSVKAGFKHLQLHAAHGYLFNLLIDPRLSRHSDFALTKLTQWANEMRSERIETSLRFSMWSGHRLFDIGRDYELIDEIAAIPVDYLDASAGFYNINKKLIYPSTPQLLTERTSRTFDIAKRHPNVNIILSGLSSHAWDVNLPQNVHIGICRDLIANANFLREQGGGCERCMKCHYYSRGDLHLSCAKWKSGR